MKLVLIMSILTLFLLSAVVNAQSATTVGAIELVPTYESLGIYSSFSGDDNANNVASLEWRKVGDTAW